ncbi:hypothetical protein Tco_0287206 [Tanacetum coccineum]
MESLGADIPGSASVGEYVEASCPNADSDCKKERETYIQTLESYKGFDEYTRIFNSGCEGYRSATSLLVMKVISSKVKSTYLAGKKGFGLLGLSSVTGSSLGMISDDEVFCDVDSAIISGEGFEGGILRRLEAFVASPIGCGGSDVGIA